jgi:hypothetical protein
VTLTPIDRNLELLVSASRSDWVLDQLARLAAIGGAGVPLTMVVGNCVISGRLASAEAFGRDLDSRIGGLVHGMENGDSVEQQARRARERLEEVLRELAGHEGEALPEDLEREALAWEAPLLVLTLADATVFRALPDAPVTVEMLRVRAQSVAAWWLGSTRADAGVEAVAARLEPPPVGDHWSPYEIEAFEPPRFRPRVHIRRHLHAVAARFRELRDQRDSLLRHVDRLEKELGLQRSAVGEALIAASHAAQSMKSDAAALVEVMLAEARSQAAETDESSAAEMESPEAQPPDDDA